MPVWTPTCRLYIGGVEYTSDSLAAVRITYGRTDITQSIRPAVATFATLHDAAGAPVTIGDDVEITLDTSTTTEVIFTGTVSDFTISVEYNDLLRYQFTAVSALAKMANTIVGDQGYSAEYQGTRISNIIRDGSGTLTWAQTNITWAAATYPWNDGTIQTGTIASGWDFGAYTASPINSLSALLKAAQFGFIYEDPDGTINFADFYSRTGSSGYTVIDAEETLRDTIRSETTSGQINNDVTISNYAGTEYTGQNAQSITAYGRRAITFDTFMSTALQITTVLNNYLSDYSIPRGFVSGFTFPLSVADTALRDLFIVIRGNTRWQVNGLPGVLGNQYKGIVEGWSWNIVQGEAFLSIYLSDYQLSQAFIPTP